MGVGRQEEREGVKDARRYVKMVGAAGVGGLGSVAGVRCEQYQKQNGPSTAT